jgi:hypothetical protein
LRHEIGASVLRRTCAVCGKSFGVKRESVPGRKRKSAPPPVRDVAAATPREPAAPALQEAPAPEVPSPAPVERIAPPDALEELADEDILEVRASERMPVAAAPPLPPAIVREARSSSRMRASSALVGTANDSLPTHEVPAPRKEAQRRPKEPRTTVAALVPAPATGTRRTRVAHKVILAGMGLFAVAWFLGTAGTDGAGVAPAAKAPPVTVALPPVATVASAPAASPLAPLIAAPRSTLAPTSPAARPSAPPAPSRSPRPLPTLAAARAALDRGDLEEAKGIYSQLLDVDSHDGEALLGMGDVARARKNTRVAASFYDAAVSASPRSPRALLALADAQWDLGEHDEARSNYRRITTAFPGESPPARVAERLQTP